MIFRVKCLLSKETYPTLDSIKFGPTPMPRDKGMPKKVIIGLRAGQSCYHGKYRQGERIIVLLAKIKGSDLCRPLGSGTYDEYLCLYVLCALKGISLFSQETSIGHGFLRILKLAENNTTSQGGYFENILSPAVLVSTCTL